MHPTIRETYRVSFELSDKFSVWCFIWRSIRLCIPLPFCCDAVELIRTSGLIHHCYGL